MPAQQVMFRTSRKANWTWTRPGRTVASTKQTYSRSTSHPAISPTRAACAPGYGGATCAICGVGSYSAGGNSTVAKPECSSCPGGFSTLTTGSQSASACGAVSTFSPFYCDLNPVLVLPGLALPA